MPALQLTGFGEPAVVVALVSQPALVAGRDEVVVALEAATVHPSDIHLIRGFYVRPQLPAPLGVEGVGKVVEWGPVPTRRSSGTASRSCRPTSRGRGLTMPS
jgi:trans-2-enoyl-CoA reductase